MSDWWLVWRMPVMLLVVMALWWFVFRPLTQEQGWITVSEEFTICADQSARSAGCVVDGDTVVLGWGEARRRIRLTGFDAPEIDGACEAERELAIRSRQRLYAWLSVGPFEWDGESEPPRDQFGRELREARRILQNGEAQYLAEVMIAEGLAAANEWGLGEQDWCE